MNSTPSSSPLAGADLCAFLVTRDAARCRAFYEGTLGFRVVSEDPMALVIDALGRAIRVQRMSDHVAKPYSVLGWNVRDLDATFAKLASVGVTFEHYGFPFQDARGVATFPTGDRVAWFKDPDGNLLSIAQLVP